MGRNSAALDLAEALEEFIGNKVQSEIENTDLSSTMEDEISEQVEKAVERYCDDMDLSDPINDALGDFDFADSIENVLRDYDLTDRVEDALNQLKEGFQKEIMEEIKAELPAMVKAVILQMIGEQVAAVKSWLVQKWTKCKTVCMFWKK